MSESTSIQWTATVHPDGSVTPGSTWNPVRGCTKVSAGCKNCYAETFAERWRGIPGHPFEQGFDLRLVADKLTLPLHWPKGRKIFVNSMSDLFHEDVPLEYIAAVFGVMACTPQHTYQILTKRAWRMRLFFLWMATQVTEDGRSRITENGIMRLAIDRTTSAPGPWTLFHRWAAASSLEWPLPNVHLGISAENQETFDERWPQLRVTPAAVRWVSFEPLLGRVDPTAALAEGLDWGVGGGESGPGARLCDLAWLRHLVAAYAAADKPFFVKQLGARPMEGGVDLVQVGRSRKGGDPEKWPKDLQVREFPR